jgi:hypothetical protein
VKANHRYPFLLKCPRNQGKQYTSIVVALPKEPMQARDIFCCCYVY